MGDPVRLNVFLRAPGAFEARLEALAALTERHGVTPFRRSGRLGHVTLFMASYPRSAQREVEARVAQVLADVLAPRLTLLEVRDAGDWLFQGVANTSRLVELNGLLAHALAPLRDPVAPPPDHARGKPDLLWTFERFGSPRVGATFRPHLSIAHAAGRAVTLARVAEEARRTSSLSTRLTAIADQVGVGEADDDGQVQRPSRVVTLLPAG